AVLDIVEVEHRSSLVNSATYRSNFMHDGILGNRTRRHQLVHREPQRDPGARDRRGADAAVGLDDVAIEHDLALAKLLQVCHRAQGTANKPLYFLRPAALLTLGRLAAPARVRGAGKHRIFGRDPSLAL